MKCPRCGQKFSLWMKFFRIFKFKWIRETPAETWWLTLAVLCAVQGIGAIAAPKVVTWVSGVGSFILAGVFMIARQSAVTQKKIAELNEKGGPFSLTPQAGEPATEEPATVEKS